MRSPPPRIETPRLVLRCWEPRDAPLLKDAIDSSLPDLQRWMDWAMSEPSELAAIEERLAKRREEFLEGRDFVYGIFDPGERLALGGSGLHPRVGPNALEIGYWIRSDHTSRGLATETARALTRAALVDAGASRVEIRCDPANTRSAAIPRRLGFRLREVLPGDTTTPQGQPRDTMVWETSARAPRR